MQYKSKSGNYIGTILYPYLSLSFPISEKFRYIFLYTVCLSLEASKILKCSLPMILFNVYDRIYKDRFLLIDVHTSRYNKWIEGGYISDGDTLERPRPVLRIRFNRRLECRALRQFQVNKWTNIIAIFLIPVRISFDDRTYAPCFFSTYAGEGFGYTF